MRTRSVLLMAVMVAAPLAAIAEQPVDLGVVTKIRDEGLNRSKVMDTAWTLTDAIGPRLTNSPAYRRAAAWARDTLAGWGLVNAHLEPFEFGRGWSFSDIDVRMVAPVEAPLIAYPKAWAPGTDGEIRGKVVQATIESEKDFDQYAGKLEGAVVFLDKERELAPPDNDVFRRYTEEELENIEAFPIRGERSPEWRQRYRRRMQFAPKLAAFLAKEGVIATVEISDRDGGLVSGSGTRGYRKGDEPKMPQLVMAAEQYNRICRLLEHDQPVELAIRVDARFWDDDTNTNNVIAEIPGTDLKDQVVMAGAHLDSWHTSTGATDDAAGCAVVMEAARILKAIGVKPRRTIRVALWSSEEQGLNGSRAYVSQHFASRAEPKDPEQRRLPEWMRRDRGALQLKPEYETLSAYYNIDNGSGKLRGIYAQENAAVVPIFTQWLKPFHDLGADTVTMRDTRGTDHLSFDAVGLPGFQFIQDPLDYMARTHHTEMDVYDRLQRADLMQASVVLASFIYNTAMRDDMMPRKPLPKDEESHPEGHEQPSH
jgi:carboxypeptidase Q